MNHDVIVLSGCSTTDQLDRYVRQLRPGGLLFVYGKPRHLPAPAVHLVRQLVFKYWIALDIDGAPRGQTLKPTHRGLLMFWKPESRFRLNTAEVRMPHALCSACGRYLKDWGGKRHLMNPRGAALSDVWRDLPRRKISDHVIPDDVLARIRSITGDDVTHVFEAMGRARLPGAPLLPPYHSATARPAVAPYLDQVVRTDCVSFLDSLPDSAFDLCFADPPYNLQKLYSGYDDAQAEHEYLAWCNRWLDGMARALKPGGSLFVLNLPKWAIHHASFLNRHLEFRHWIAWDALSEPRGKLMPAHYALLYYTKPGGPPVFNAVPPPDAPKYCLRAKCIQQRKARGDDEKVELSDVWSDIHRIKHKRDREAHPCQLPEKLMERIILLTTNPGDVVFDPFCGTGTTAVVAKRLGRNYVVTDTDSNYIRISHERLAAANRPRASVVRPRAAASKREVETYLQQLSLKLKRVPKEEEIAAEMLSKIDLLYPYRGAALKRCRIVL